MSDHVSIERMNEAVDGFLASGEMQELEAHLLECDACRNAYARLGEVVSAARALPRAGMVPDADEVWLGIADRIGAAQREERDVATVVPLPVQGPREDASRGRGGRRITLSIAQLATAAVLVALLSAMTVWFAFDGRAHGPETVAEGPTLAGAAARAVSLEDNRYVEVIDQLQRILERGSSVLAPETLATIEQSLRTVDAAIADVEAALDDDPGSDLLLRMLANYQKTKLGVLQRAAAAVQAQT